ncbi:hypothetical protein BST63_10550 [Bradyrhizobium canariense]|uniref:Phage tail collar domain-containing protein n=1 Tax=Bradyrhizobium canariense TaxID=255045 RepID=A0ABX3X7L0_9BRAD|nr:tail fiber protein [Bradyrhizobium canariense]OSJ16842.1 hypothetical protein BSR47_11710 [Bradyrhizobium canariense]OSJ31077.1 hypothetical protein BST63_10550 [Bradyrhizobium canariense]
MTAGAVNTWSQTAASNASADTTVNWLEGQAPSTVNDSARAMMASVAKYRDDNNGSLVATGTSTAFVLTTNQGVASTPTYGQSITFVPSATSASGVTLAVDGGTAYPINSALNVAAPPGTLVASTPYIVRFDTANGGQWLLTGFFGNPYNIPIGGVLDYAGTSAPNSNFVLPYGQGISRTTYAAFFALVGTTYGSGDGSTTFNIPDLRGRVVSGKDDMGGSSASRLGGGIITGTTLGASAGSDVIGLAAANIPSHTHSGNTGTESNLHTHGFNAAQVTGGNPGITGSALFGVSNQNLTTGNNNQLHTHPFTTDGGSGLSGTAHSNMQPTIILNKLLRII